MFVQEFQIMETEVTVDQFDSFVKETGYVTTSEVIDENRYSCVITDYEINIISHDVERNWKYSGFSREGDHPVVCVSYQDVQTYANWLSDITGQNYRLPTELEWDYAATPGTDTTFLWGERLVNQCNYANAADLTPSSLGRSWTYKANCIDDYWYTAPVGRYLPNKFGLYDMAGNVAEWVQGCFVSQDTYKLHGGVNDEDKAPINCKHHIIKGGSWASVTLKLRPHIQGKFPNGLTYNTIGFRLVRDLLD
ncbi:formylglycine-generating enzyme family protein [Marinomonas aquiplantarum]|nr:SUMF1/EgtB/PvdO family nonheme iron enzyme [Marinomonas aquiplantarum]